MCIQSLDPWMSDADIDKGERWFEKVESALKSAGGQGIFCLTPENTTSPWLNFEAGVVASSGGKARVYSLLIGLEPVELKPPISLFQATTTTKEDIFKLLKVLNVQCAKPVPDRVLVRTFEATWTELETAIATSIALVARPPVHAVNVPDGIAELVAISRRMERSLEEQSSSIRDLVFFGNVPMPPAHLSDPDIFRLNTKISGQTKRRNWMPESKDSATLLPLILAAVQDLQPQAREELAAALARRLPEGFVHNAAFFASKGISPPDTPLQDRLGPEAG
jgi:hypothetical protein